MYRHFPDREALLAGLSDRLADLSETGAPRAALDSIDDVPQVAVALMATLDEHHVAARGEALLNATPAILRPGPGRTPSSSSRCSVASCPSSTSANGCGSPR